MSREELRVLTLMGKRSNNMIDPQGTRYFHDDILLWVSWREREREFPVPLFTKEAIDLIYSYIDHYDGYMWKVYIAISTLSILTAADTMRPPKIPWVNIQTFLVPHPIRSSFPFFKLHRYFLKTTNLSMRFSSPQPPPPQKIKHINLFFAYNSHKTQPFWNHYPKTNPFNPIVSFSK